MKKKVYFQPSMKVFIINDEDIIATSVDRTGLGSNTHAAKGYYGDYDEDF